MPDLRDIIAKGKELTGRKLLDALEIAGKPPTGGRGVIVTARGSSDAVLNRTGHPIIVSRKRVEAILQAPIAFRADGNGFQVEYRYPWAEAEIDASGLWIVKPGGKASTDPTRVDAINYAELLNENPGGSGVSYGIPIDSVVAPEYHIDGVSAIPAGQPVTMIEGKIVATGILVYYFEATNHLNLICGMRGAAAGVAIHLSPSGEALVPELSRRMRDAEARLQL